MYKSQNLLQTFLQEAQCNHKRTDLGEQRFYELESGVLKFCIGIELFQHAWRNKELDILRKELFKYVQHMSRNINFVSEIETLELKIDRAITCLENIKINSQNLKLLCLYLKCLRNGNFYLPEAYKTISGGLPMRK